MKTTGLASFIVLILLCSVAFGYDQDHPPYLFKNGPFRHISDTPLAYKGIPLFIKKDMGPEYMSPTVYRTNLIGNGPQDYICFVHQGASPLVDEIHIYLKKPQAGYRKISFSEDPSADIRDMVDINHDGKWEAVLADLYSSGEHSYIAYSVYEFKNYRLVNADKKYKGFPKFIWFTNKKNDKDTDRLTAKERQRDVEDKNKAIEYREIGGE